MMITQSRMLWAAALSLAMGAVAAAGDPSLPHLRKQGTATQLVVDGKPMLMLAGELHNSSTSDAGYMKPIWPRMAAMGLNTVIAPVSWELIEPAEGRFDFVLVDGMIDGARRNDLRLVLIWFGSWKNGASTYEPSWVKKDIERFPRVKDAQGRTQEILSTFGGASRDADALAFAALMRHLRDVDGRRHTVVMVQVENEVGVLNAPRDFSPAASAAFDGPVPRALMDYLEAHRDALVPELRELWETNGFKPSGTWEEVFGKGTSIEDDWTAYSHYPEEIFMAWNYAQYVGRVAAAGKAEYPLPMYANAWLKQPDYGSPGRYPSGGPLPQVMDIWRAGAPAIDLIAPDIYMPEFEWICGQYHRGGNPLFIPETRGGAVGAARVFWSMGRHDAMGFSPFGIDSSSPAEAGPMAQSYSILSQLAPLILQNQGGDKMAGLLVTTNQPMQRVTLGDYLIEARLGGARRGLLAPEVAGGIVIATGPGEFIVAGKSLDVFFKPKVPGDLPWAAIDFVDEGTFQGGHWVPGRRLNGDEVHTSTFDGTGLRLYGPQPSIQRVKLYRYP